MKTVFLVFLESFRYVFGENEEFVNCFKVDKV